MAGLLIGIDCALVLMSIVAVVLAVTVVKRGVQDVRRTQVRPTPPPRPDPPPGFVHSWGLRELNTPKQL